MLLPIPDSFWEDLRGGRPVVAAAAAAGVSLSTGRRWLARAGGPRAVGAQPAGRGRRLGGIPDSVVEAFWAALTRGEQVAAAAAAAGVSKTTGKTWVKQAGGMRPRVCNPELEATVTPGRGPLSFTDRCRIEELTRIGYHPARVAALLGRPRSTIGRELARGAADPGSRVRYRAVLGQTRVEANRERAGRPTKLVAGTALYKEVVQRLTKRSSPEQIAGRLRVDFPEQPEMWVSHETIYQALYVQPRGELAAAVKQALRTGRTRRKPHGRPSKAPTVKGMVMIADRPAEVEDRAVAGHWEGDLILGAGNKSAIGTLVERTTGFVILLHLPGDHTAETTATAMQAAITRLPEHLWRSLTWDQGTEMALHTKITAETGIPVYFCDPHSPWQRGTNENTNGLLRQYFPKSTDLSFYGPGLLDQAAAELNARPRKRHHWATPAEKLEQLLSTPTEPVASTA